MKRWQLVVFVNPDLRNQGNFIIISAGGSFSRVHATIYLISQQRENFKGKRKTKKWLFAFLLLLLSCVCKALSMEWVLEEEFHFFKNFVFTKGFFSATSKVLNEKWREEKHFFYLTTFLSFFYFPLLFFFHFYTYSFCWQQFPSDDKRLFFVVI